MAETRICAEDGLKNGGSAHENRAPFRNDGRPDEPHGFRNALKWMLVDHRRAVKQAGSASYRHDPVPNDGRLLRENHRDFTVTWIGHSTVLVQLDGLNILADPIWSERASPVGFAGPKRHVAPGVRFEDLPDIHVVLISHNHYDHFDRATIRRFGNRPLYLVPRGLGSLLEKSGVYRYKEFGWWESIRVEDAEITCTPARHFSARGLFDRNRALWCGWAVRGAGGSVFLAGDTGYFPGFADIGRRLGPFDLACLPIGAYLPSWFMSPVHMSPGEAIDAFHDLGARRFLAIHWGTFTLADDPPDMAPRVLREEIGRRGLDASKFWLLQQGETRPVRPE